MKWRDSFFQTAETGKVATDSLPPGCQHSTTRSLRYEPISAGSYRRLDGQLPGSVLWGKSGVERGSANIGPEFEGVPGGVVCAYIKDQ